MGKKAFSAKAKREQLRQKRQATNINNALATSSTPSASSTTQNPSPRRGRPQKSNQVLHRHRLMFVEDTEAARKRQRAQAHLPLSQPSLTDYETRKMGVDAVRPYPDVRYAMPKRPEWTYKDTVTSVNKREVAMFNEWLQRVSRPEDPLVAYFEGNLETWRQLWRVIERSDVLVLVADIRFPALHFVPELYYYVTGELGKGMVLALNKCDLVPAEVLLAWKRYFEQRYQGLAVAMFSSFPDAKLAPSVENSELLSRREKRMARSKLSAWGADQLLAAVETLGLEERKKAYLGQWRKKLDAQAEDDDEDDDGDVNFLEQALRNGGVAVENTLKNRDTIADTVLPGSKENVKEHVAEVKVSKKRRRRAKNSEAAPKLPPFGNGKCKKGNNERKSIVQKNREDSGHGPNNMGKLEDDSDVESNLIGMGFLGDEEDSIRENMITIGVVGHPNAGKSSMINGVFRKKVVSTSRTPGHTKHLQTIFLSESVRLCDCPGLVFPGNAPRELQILAGMYPISQVREPYVAIKYLAERVPLIDILNLELEIPKLEIEHEEPGYISLTGWTGWKICEAWALKRGFRTAKAARLDVYRAANNILRLALDGRIVLATVPQDFSLNTDASSRFANDVTWDVHDDADACVVSASGRVAAVLSGTYDDEDVDMSSGTNDEDEDAVEEGDEERDVLFGTSDEDSDVLSGRSDEDENGIEERNEDVDEGVNLNMMNAFSLLGEEA